MFNKMLKFSVFLVVILLPWNASATSWQTESTIYVGPEETIDGNLYFSSQNVVVNGNITGDLIGVAQSIEVTGRIEGDILAIAQNIDLDGEILGNARVLTNNLTVTGLIKKNLNYVGSALFIGPEANIGWDALIASMDTDIRGKITGNLTGLVSNFNFNGTVDKNILLRTDPTQKNISNLNIGDQAIIGGDFVYYSTQAANISPQAKITGESFQRELADKQKTGLSLIWKFLYSIFSAILVGLILVNLFNKQTQSLTKLMADKPNWILLWGLGFVILLPIFLIILMVTVIGIPLALILSAGWLIVLYLAKILTAIFIGQQIIKRGLKQQKNKHVWELIFGVIITWSLFLIPLIGSYLSMLAILWGAGTVSLYLKQRLN